MEQQDVWASDEEFPVSDWQAEVAANNTRLGYWDWVEHQREAKGS